MPIMPAGGFRDITTLRANAKTLRNLLSYADRKKALTNPKAIEWKRELAELDRVIAEFERENAA